MKTINKIGLIGIMTLLATGEATGWSGLMIFIVNVALFLL